MVTVTFILACAAILAGSHASVAHVAPVFRTFPVTRYAPFYSFPNGVRSIHAIAPPPVAPAPVLPAPPLYAPRFAPAVQFSPIVRAVAPAPVFPAPAPVFPAPAPVFPAPAPAFPAPAPVFPAPAPVFPAPAPVFPAPAPVYPAPAPVFPAPAPLYPAPAPFFPAPPPVFPGVPSAQALALAKAFPYSIPPHANQFRIAPPPALVPGPAFRQAW